VPVSIQPPAPSTAQSAAAAHREVDDRRNAIAQAMWASYQEVLQQRLQQQATEKQVNEFLYDIDIPIATRLLGKDDDDTEEGNIQDDDENMGRSDDEGI
jgi:hypothetical protein